MPQDMLARMAVDMSGAEGDLTDVRALIEEASDRGAAKALERLGLSDAHARRDIDELRELLGAWRDAKSSALKGALHWIGRLLIALLLLGLATRFGVGDGLMKEILP